MLIIIITFVLAFLSIISVLNSESEIQRNSDELNDIHYFRYNETSLEVNNSKEDLGISFTSTVNVCPSLPKQDINAVDFIHTDSDINSTV